MMPRDRCMRSALATRRGRQHAGFLETVVKLIQLADALTLHTVVEDMHRAQGQIHKQSAQAKARRQMRKISSDFYMFSGNATHLVRFLPNRAPKGSDVRTGVVQTVRARAIYTLFFPMTSL
jgi:nucleoid-associated protein YejK